MIALPPMPEIHYRLVQGANLNEWSVEWQMGRLWTRVSGPATQAVAREALAALVRQTL